MMSDFYTNALSTNVVSSASFGKIAVPLEFLVGCAILILLSQ